MGPVLLLILPMLGAALVYGLRRWRDVPSLVAAGVCVVEALALLLVPFDRPITVLGREIMLGRATALLGRELVLGPSTRGAIVFLLLTGAGLFLLAWRVDPGGLFASLGLGLLGLLGGVLLVRPLIYAALLVQIAAALSVFPLHSDPRSPTRGGLRYVTFFTLALPGLLVSHWLLDMYAITPDQVGLLYTAAGLIGFSFALMLGVVPFHPWVPAVGRDGAPLVSAFLFSATGGTVWFLLLDYLQAYPWLSESPQWASILTTLGVVTAVVGGLLGTVRWSPGRLMGYLVMVDTGMTLVALGQSSRTGVDLSVAMVFARAWGTALMASGLGRLRAQTQGMNQAMTGLGQRAPWSTAALVVGGLSLAGFPLTAGFGPRWGLYRVLARSQPLVALVLLLITGGPLVGLLRMLRQLLSQPPTITSLEEEQQEEEPPPELPEPTVVVVLQILLIIAALGLGLLPQVLTTSAARVGASFTFFGP